MFNFLSNFKKKSSAKIAKERLQLILSHERRASESPFIDDIKEELIAVLSKYFRIDRDAVEVVISKSDTAETLEVNIPINRDF